MTRWKKMGWLALAAFWAGPAWGLGLKTRFADVSVDKIKIGKTYSMNDLLNFPLRVLNTSPETLPLEVEVTPPTGAELKPGYEVIPDTSWVRLQQSTFTVDPGKEAVTDVIIALPNDEKLLGRRFQVFLWTTTQNVSTTGVGLKSRLLMSVASVKPTDDELKAKFVQKRLANMNFNISPMEVLIEDVPVGRAVNLAKEKKTKILLSNPNDEDLDFRVASVGPWETSLGVTPGFEPAVDPKVLEIKTPIVKAKPESFQPIELSASFPDEDQYRGRSYMFVLRVEILEQDIPAYAYVRVYIRTRK